jgi:hypothetical protein
VSTDQQRGANGVARQLDLALVMTSALSTVFFRGQIARLREAGFRVTFICNPRPPY